MIRKLIKKFNNIDLILSVILVLVIGILLYKFNIGLNIPLFTSPKQASAVIICGSAPNCNSTSNCETNKGDNCVSGGCQANGISSYCPTVYPGYSTTCYNFTGSQASQSAGCSWNGFAVTNYYAVCNTPTWNGKCVAPTINSLSVKDNTANLTMSAGWYRPEGDSITASITYTSNFSISYHWTVVETNPSTNQTSTTTSTSSTDTFTLAAAPGTRVPDVLYPYTISVYISNAYGNSATSTFSFYMYTPANTVCNTPNNNGTLLGTDFVDTDIVLFDNNPTSGCQTGYYTPNPPTSNLITTSGANLNSIYNSYQKDSMLYYPGRNDTIIESNIQGSVYVVHWTFQQYSEQNIIVPGSVTVLKLMYDSGNLNLHDMDIDTLGPNGTPLYFWLSSSSYVDRIPWSTISTTINAWLAAGAPASYPSYTPFLTNNASYEFLSTGISFADAILVDDTGPRVYVNIASTNGNEYMESFNPTGANGQTPIAQIFLGTNANGVGTSPNPILASGWRADGMTYYKFTSGTYAGNSYIFSTSTYGRVIWVIQNPDTATPSILGTTVINAPINAIAGQTTGLDGTEMDSYGQMYIAGYGSGIWSIDANRVVKEAAGNGYNFYGPFWVNAIQYTTATGSEKWDDIAPLAGSGASQISYTPYYYTRGANTFTDGTYSISTLSNDPSTTGNAYFSSYGLIDSSSGGCCNTFANGVTPSLYNWEFDNYTSDLNRLNGTYQSPPVYGYTNLYNTLCSTNSGNTCTPISIDNGTINSTANSTPLTGASSTIYTYDATGNQHGGTLIIDGEGSSGTGITGNGILFVKGNVQINADRNNNFNTGNNRLMVIASGNVTIQSSSYYNTTTGLQYQYANLGLIADGTISFSTNYTANTNYVLPLKFVGFMASYGGISFGGFNIGYLNRYIPAIEVDFEPIYINNFSNFFAKNQNTQEIGQ